MVSLWLKRKNRVCKAGTNGTFILLSNGRAALFTKLIKNLVQFCKYYEY